MSKAHKLPLIGTVTVVLVTLTCFASGLASTELGGSSPEEVFNRMRTAASEADYESMAGCISPEGRAGISVMMFLAAGMSAAFSQMGEEMAAEMAEAADAEPPQNAQGEDLTAKLEALLARHGLDQAALEAAGPASGELPEQVESPEFFADIMTFVDEIPGEDGAAEQFQIPEGELTDVTIEGNQATAKLGDTPIEFVRIDGRWYLEPNMGF